MTSRRDIKWPKMSWQMDVHNFTQVTPSKSRKFAFFQRADLDLWPMTLTFKLIRAVIKVIPPAEFQVCTSNGSPVRALNNGQTHRHTHTHTDRTDFIPSTANAGGKKCEEALQYVCIAILHLLEINLKPIISMVNIFCYGACSNFQMSWELRFHMI